MTHYNDYRSGIRYKLGISWVHEIPANYKNITMIQWKKKKKKKKTLLFEREIIVFTCASFWSIWKEISTFPTLFQLTMPNGISQNIVYFW